MIKLTENRVPSEICMRDAYCNAVVDLAREDKRIVSVEADVVSSMGMEPFRAEFPERSINCGIQEANAVGVAAGLSLAGYKPTFNAFATFASRRVFDQVFVSCGYNKANVKIFAGDAGVTSGANGATHMACEDLAAMSTVPGMTVLEPADTVAMYKIAKAAFGRYGNTYIRSARKIVTNVYDEVSDFEIGKANVLREGADVTIVACGILVDSALAAAEKLAREGISAAVIDSFTIKPIDEECIVDWARRTGAVVTAENHNIYGGLDSIVAGVLARTCPVPMEFIAVHDVLGEDGEVSFLRAKYGLTEDDIVTAAKKAVARK